MRHARAGKVALETLRDALIANPDALGAHGVYRCIDAEGEPIDSDGAYVRKGLVDGCLVTCHAEKVTSRLSTE